MGFLFAPNKKNTVPSVTGLQIQTSVNTMPIPIIYGSPRLQMNIIYVNGFRSSKTSQGKGGKGILTQGKGGTDQTEYHATFIGALGEGPLGSPRAIFDNQSVYLMSNIPPGRTLTYFSGTAIQTPWSVITSKWPADAFGYKDTAYVGGDDYKLDSSATLPQLGYIIDGLFCASSPLNLFTAPDATTWFMDADPAQVIVDFLTNEVHGAGFPVAYLDLATLLTSGNGFNPIIGDKALSTYCQAVGLAWSAVVNNTESASSVLSRWCDNLVVAAVWTGSILKFIPYWDSFIGANPGWNAGAGIDKKYFAPDVTPVFDLTDDDFVEGAQDEDPVIATRTDIADTKNVVRLNYKDRGNLWNDNVVEAKDENAAELYGVRVDNLGVADEFTLGAYASVSAQMRLQRFQSVRNTYSFKLGWQYCVLDPMDIVTITDEVLGLTKFPVRITSIEEDEKGILTIMAEEFPLGAATATAYPRQVTTPPLSYQTNIPPASVNTPVIAESTTGLITAQGGPGGMPVVFIGASGGTAGVADPNWGGANVYVSADNITYVKVSTITAPARQGLTTATLPAYASTNPDTVNTLSVNLAMSAGVLEGTDPANAANGATLCLIIDAAGHQELLSFEVATLTSAYHYNLTRLYRGLYGTTACSHASGAQFLRIDDALAELPIPPAYIGHTVYVKLQSFNIFGQATQDLSAVTPFTYTPTAAGFDPNANAIATVLMAGGYMDLGHTGDTYTANLDLSLGGGAFDCMIRQFQIDFGVLV